MCSVLTHSFIIFMLTNFTTGGKNEKQISKVNLIQFHIASFFTERIHTHWKSVGSMPLFFSSKIQCSPRLFKDSGPLSLHSSCYAFVLLQISCYEVH